MIERSRQADARLDRGDAAAPGSLRIMGVAGSSMEGVAQRAALRTFGERQSTTDRSLLVDRSAPFGHCAESVARFRTARKSQLSAELARQGPMDDEHAATPTGLGQAANGPIRCTTTFARLLRWIPGSARCTMFAHSC